MLNGFHGVPIKYYLTMCAFIMVLSGCATHLQRGIDAFSEGNYDLAAKHWLPIAEGNNKDAQYNMGVLYEHGYGSLEKDLDTASRWYLRAIEQGHIRAMFRLAGVLELKNTDAAISWYTFAARWGNQKAIKRLSELNQPIPTADLLYAKQRRDAYSRQRTASFFQSLGAAISNTNQSFQNQNNFYSPPYISSTTCGLKQIPKVGCRIGRCVDGHWEQICDSSPTLSCGLKPIPKIGCRVGRCVDGHWEQICDSSPALSCGLKPIPKIGCRVGRCVDGHWEQICS